MRTGFELLFSSATSGPICGCLAEAEQTKLDREAALQTLFFVHIPKAAGSSFRAVLKRWFGRELMIFDSHDRKAFTRAWENRDAPPGAVAGHFSYGLHEAAPQCRPLYISLVRDPVDRFVSLYKHARATPRHVMHAAADSGLEDFFVRTLDDPRARGRTVAIQCFFLTGARSFQEARPVLDEAYRLIAPVESFRDFMERAARILGKPDILTAPRNVRSSEPELFEAADRLADQIREEHAEDQRLYEYVRGRFAAFG